MTQPGQGSGPSASGRRGITEAIAAPRVDLTPLTPDDAAEMVGVLAEIELYAFIGGSPPTYDELHARYTRQAVGHSADGTEDWHNWIIRTRPDGRATGFVQATLTEGGRQAEIAWLVGLGWQGQGYATEAATAMVAWLDTNGVVTITASVHPDHLASEAVARRIGLTPTKQLIDGERVWQRGGSPRSPPPME